MATADCVPLPARAEFVTGEVVGRDLRCAEAFYPGGLTLPEHAHENLSITIAYDGFFDESYGRRSRVRCEMWTHVVRPPRQSHSDRIGPRGSRLLEIEFGPSWLGDEDLVASIRDPWSLRHPALSYLSRSIRAEMSINDSARTLLCEGAALELLGRLLRIGSGSPGRRRPPSWLRRVRERLDAGFHDDIRFADLAREAGVHAVHLARAFRVHYGTSPGGYVRRLRIGWAAEALRHAPDKHVTEIAHEAGFYDHSHFARVFKAATGLTPSRYRSVADD
jgi:AraC family transcriptional regulator